MKNRQQGETTPAYLKRVRTLGDPASDHAIELVSTGYSTPLIEEMLGLPPDSLRKALEAAAMPRSVYNPWFRSWQMAANQLIGEIHRANQAIMGQMTDALKDGVPDKDAATAWRSMLATIKDIARLSTNPNHSRFEVGNRDHRIVERKGTVSEDDKSGLVQPSLYSLSEATEEEKAAELEKVAGFANTAVPVPALQD